MKLKLSVTLLVVTTAIAILSACSSSKKAKTTSTDATAKTEEIIVPNYTAAELEEGKMLWEKHCDRCHKLYLPGNYTKEKWERILPRMFKRSKLEGEDAGKVRGYLMSLAKADS